MFCPNCGNQLENSAAFCPQCGKPLNRAAPPVTPVTTVYVQVPPQAPGKSRLAYILLGLFLGGLGIHNFYAGYVGRGIAQLLITVFTGWLVLPLLIVGIWCLIEVIAVTRDAQGVGFS